MIAVAAYVRTQISMDASSDNILSVENDEDVLDVNGKKRRWDRTRRLFRGIRMKLRRKAKNKKNTSAHLGEATTNEQNQISGRMDALTKNEHDVLLRTKELVKDLEVEAKALPWGGPGNYSGKACAWWGDELLASYLIIMKFPEVSRSELLSTLVNQ